MPPSKHRAGEAREVDLEHHVRTCLKILRHGDFFTEFGLSESEELVDRAGHAQSRKEKGHAFNRFLSAVASCIVKEVGAGAGTTKKKATKAYSEQLFGDAERWWLILKQERASRRATASAAAKALPSPSRPGTTVSASDRKDKVVDAGAGAGAVSDSAAAVAASTSKAKALSELSSIPRKVSKPSPEIQGGAESEVAKKGDPKSKNKEEGRADDAKAVTRDDTSPKIDIAEKQSEPANDDGDIPKSAQKKKKKTKKAKMNPDQAEETENDPKSNADDDIDSFIDDSELKPTKKKGKKGVKKKGKKGENDDIGQQTQDGNDSEVDPDGPKERKKGKKRKAESNLVSEADRGDRSPTPMQTIEEYQKLKEEFEREKADVLADVPDDVKENFGMVCFAEWKPKPLPALVMSPYTAPPGPGREEWFEMYNKVKASNRLKKMTNLVYWYGTSKSPTYSLLTTPKLIPLEEARKKGFDKLTKPQQKKLESGNPTEEILSKVSSLEEMEADIKKKPSERRGFLPAFQEVYEFDPSEEPMEYGDTEVFDKEPKQSRKKPRRNSSLRKGKGKKYNVTDKAKDMPGADEESDRNEQVEEISRPMKKKKLKKLNPAKNEDKNENENSSTRAKPDEGVDVLPQSQMQMHQPQIQLQMQPQPQPEEIKKGTDKVSAAKSEARQTFKPNDTDSVGSPDYPSEDGPDEDASTPSESDVRDEDFNMELDAEPKKSKTKSKKLSKAEKTEKSLPIAKTKIHSKKAGKSSIDQKAAVHKEMKAFAKCENHFGDLIVEWETALEEKDEAAIRKIIKKAINKVDEFSAPFIEVYELPKLLKMTKRIVDTPDRTELWSNLKIRYYKMQKLLPKDFKMPKRSKSNVLSTKTGDDPGPSQAPNVPKKTKALNTDDDVNDRPKVSNESGEKEEPGASGGGTAAKIKVETSPLEKTPALPKQEKKKKFSLGNLMRPGAKEPKMESKSVPDKVIQTEKAQTPLILPSWVTKPAEGGVELDMNRAFALEFLQQGVRAVPSINGANHDAIARSIEASIYAKSQEAVVTNKDDAYWEMIHNLAASIHGKEKPGTLALLIAKGRITSPSVLTDLTRDELSASFHHRPIDSIS